MSIRTLRIYRRLGDAAADNISTAIWGNTQYGVESGQQALIDQTNRELAAQGINPATATPAQVMAVFSANAQLAQEEAYAQIPPQNVYVQPPVVYVPPAPIPPQPAPIAPPAPIPPPAPTPAQPAPPAPAPPAPAPPTPAQPAAALQNGTLAPAPAAADGFSLSAVPTWAWAAAAGAALLLFKGK
jgi:hypothetical protein